MWVKIENKEEIMIGIAVVCVSYDSITIISQEEPSRLVSYQQINAER